MPTASSVGTALPAKASSASPPETNPQPPELVCPYCERRNENDAFLTPGQSRVLQEAAARSFQDELRRNPLGELKLNRIPDQGAAMCAAERTETEIVCTECSLRFAVHRTPLACPRCGCRPAPGTT